MFETKKEIKTMQFISTNEKVDYINELLKKGEDLEFTYKLSSTHIFIEIKGHEVFKTNNILNGFGYLPINSKSFLFVNELISNKRELKINTISKNPLFVFDKKKEANIYMELK